MIKKVVRKHNNSGNCFVCGLDNPFGLHAAFYELEDGSVCALVTADPRHQSYPGRVHGGVICAMLDETMGPRHKRHGAGHLGPSRGTSTYATSTPCPTASRS